MAANDYIDLIPLTAALSELNREEDIAVERTRAQFGARRAEIQAKIDTVAARILTSKTAVKTAETLSGTAPGSRGPTGSAPSSSATGLNGATGSTGPGPAPRAVVHEPAREPLPQVPPRRIKLLRLMVKHPDADSAMLVMAMYGRDDRGTRGGLSAEFSGLKADGLVEPIENEKGKFRLTQLARRVLAQHQAQETAA
jgi:hypothetical protein